MHLIFFFGLVLMLGLIVSKALISIGMLGIVGLGLWQGNWRQLRQRHAFLVATLPFFIMLASGIYTQNLEMLLGQLRIALPLLGLPLAFALLPPMPRHLFFSWLYAFVLMISVAAFGVLMNYLLDYEAIQQALVVSKAVPTPQGDHIRFSLLMVLAVFAAGYVRAQGFVWKYRWERHLQLFLLLFLVVMIHLVSVRSGLLGLYLAALVLLLRWIWLQRRFLLGFLLLLGLLSAPFVAFFALPSVQVKYYLMHHNLSLFAKGEIGEYSDTQRLLSYYAAWQVAKPSPWLGVGMGDVRDAQVRYYAEHYPSLQAKYPHNQFLLYYVGTGILGLIAFVAAFFYPIFIKKYRRNGFFIAFFVLIFSSFLTENTLSIAIGMGIYAFFLSAAMNYLEENGEEMGNS